MESFSYKSYLYFQKNWIPYLTQFVRILKPDSLYIGITTNNASESFFSHQKRKITRQKTLEHFYSKFLRHIEMKRKTISIHIKNELGKTPNNPINFFNNYYFGEYSMFCNNFLFEIYKVSIKSETETHLSKLILITQCAQCDNQKNFGLPCCHLMGISIDKEFLKKFIHPRWSIIRLYSAYSITTVLKHDENNIYKLKIDKEDHVSEENINNNNIKTQLIPEETKNDLKNEVKINKNSTFESTIEMHKHFVSEAKDRDSSLLTEIFYLNKHLAELVEKDKSCSLVKNTLAQCSELIKMMSSQLKRDDDSIRINNLPAKKTKKNEVLLTSLIKKEINLIPCKGSQNHGDISITSQSPLSGKSNISKLLQELDIDTNLINNYLPSPHDITLFRSLIPNDSIQALLRPTSMLDNFVIDAYLNLLQSHILATSNCWLITRCHLFTSILTGHSEMARDYLTPKALNNRLAMNA